MRHDQEAVATLPGGASHVATIAGAAASLDEMAHVRGWAGVSAGALVAIAKAFRVADDKIKRTLIHALADNRLLDVAPFELGDLGLCGWHVVPTLIDELIGRDAKMSDAATALVVCVTDLDTGQPRYLSKRHTPSVLVREAARASSAFPLVAPQVPIPSWTGPSRLYTDGGVTDNTCDAVFDVDEWSSVPRIAVRLVGREPERSITLGDPVGQALAIVRGMQHRAGEIKSRRANGVVVDVPRVGDGMDFSLSREQVIQRWTNGRAAVASARAAILSRIEVPYDC